MSASIYWEPIKSSSKTLTAYAPSSFIRIMTEVYGNYPWVISNGDRDVINGMASAYQESIKNNPFNEILDLLDKYGSIRLWAEY